jgi:hypothetical protein
MRLTHHCPRSFKFAELPHVVFRDLLCVFFLPVRLEQGRGQVSMPTWNATLSPSTVATPTAAAKQRPIALYHAYEGMMQSVRTGDHVGSFPRDQKPSKIYLKQLPTIPQIFEHSMCIEAH